MSIHRYSEIYASREEAEKGIASHTASHPAFETYVTSPPEPVTNRHGETVWRVGYKTYK